MGDMAEYTLDCIDFESYSNPYAEQNGEWEAPAIRTIVCRCCHKAGLEWHIHNGKWRLFDQRGLHACPVNPLIENFPTKGQTSNYRK